jgi:hypothetical protein
MSDQSTPPDRVHGLLLRLTVEHTELAGSADKLMAQGLFSDSVRLRAAAFEESNRARLEREAVCSLMVHQAIGSAFARWRGLTVGSTARAIAADNASVFGGE